MENYISYIAGGAIQKFPTSLSFQDNNDAFVAQRLYLEVAFDRDEKLIAGTIRRILTEEEKQNMNEEEICEWHRISNIEFFDYVHMKKMSMKHMSDFQGNYCVENL